MKVKKLEEIDIGNQVFCDGCNKDYTLDSKTTGGLLFVSKAYCPECAPEIESSAKEFGEEEYIKARCPKEMSFRDWCLSLRNGNNKIVIHSFDFEGDSKQ